MKLNMRIAEAIWVKVINLIQGSSGFMVAMPDTQNHIKFLFNLLTKFLIKNV